MAKNLLEVAILLRFVYRGIPQATSRQKHKDNQMWALESLQITGILLE